MEALAASINETARALSLGRTSVYALIREGRLETVKLGRRTLVKVASIRRLLDAQ
jgi:excisionase family DNA binding protein